MPAKKRILSAVSPSVASSVATTEAASPDCEVCCEKLNKTKNKPIKCSFCEYVACQNCCQTFIVGSIREASCMSCKKAWSREFLSDNFTQKFVKTDYKTHREKTLYDREKALLPQTQPIAEAAAKRVIEEQIIKKLQEKMKDLANEMRAAERRRNGAVLEERDAIDISEGRVPFGRRFAGGGAAAAAAQSETIQKKFVSKCPKEDCRGFMSENFTCGLCNTKCCKKCNAILNAEEESDKDDDDSVVCVLEGDAEATTSSQVNENPKPKHKCKQEDVETAKLLKKDTKPCPSCGAMIHKIDGCNQMWCTQCHNAFDWRTGEIEKGPVHNPEYFRYMRERGERVAPLPGAAAGAGAAGYQQPCRQDRGVSALLLRQISDLGNGYLKEDEKRRLDEICRNILHHQQVTLRETLHIDQTGNRTLRVDFLLGRVTEKDFMAAIQKREKSNEKKTELRNVVDMIVAASSDIVLRFTEKLFQIAGGRRTSGCGEQPLNPEARKEWEAFTIELEALVDYANDRLSKISTIYNCKSYTFSSSTLKMNIGQDPDKRLDLRRRYGY